MILLRSKGKYDSIAEGEDVELLRLFEQFRPGHFSIYVKLVISFLLLVVPIVAVSLVMNYQSERLVSSQIAASMASKVHYYLSALENEIVQLNRFKTEFVN